MKIKDEVLPKIDRKEINKIQTLHLDLIELTAFNALDGKQVANDLIANRQLWDAVIISREAWRSLPYPEDNPDPIYDCPPIDLIHLRDMPYNHHNVDTLYILTTKNNMQALKMLADNWCADEIDWIKDKYANRMLGGIRSDSKLLRLWWD